MGRCIIDHVFVVEKVYIDPNLALQNDRCEIQHIFSDFNAVTREYGTLQWKPSGYWITQCDPLHERPSYFRVSLWDVRS